MTDAEFQRFLADPTKRIDGDLAWSEDDDHSPTVEFRTPLTTAANSPMFVRGSWNRVARTLSFAIIHRSVGRIYALDLGRRHRNPTSEWAGETHKHAWTEQFRDKHAYAPQDITASVEAPDGVWQQFCREARIVHHGRILPPPPIQGTLF